ncbi:MAG: sigma-70 family RNA polymerase sigma factor [Oscillibacter sp.]|nr:sigma-70 family RNA polymerase sigma factor [Oscillibacter sp.]
MEDVQIIDLYWLRDERAIRETDIKYGGFCHKIAMNILHSFQDSEECVSDAYGRCWDTMPPQRPMSLRAYLGTILRNLSISRYRSGRAQKRFGGAEVLLSELNDCVPAPENVQRTLEAAELGDFINRWLRGLETEDRALFVHRYWNGDGVKELAGELGVRPNALTKRLLRLRESLRRSLEKEGLSV